MARGLVVVRLVLGLCVAVAASSCSSDMVVPDLDFSTVDVAMEGFIAENELTGATIVVVHRDYGIVHMRGYGGFDVNRVSLLASSSKIITAGVLMRLADRGLVDLDAPISNYLAPLYGDDTTDITIAQMLSNSSGMLGLIDNPTYGPYLCQYIYAGSLEGCMKIIYTADDDATRVPPDTAFRYGGGQWQLAGGIAELVSGKSWAELIEETYTRPCDLAVLGYTNQYAEGFGNGGVEGSLAYPSYFEADVSNLRYTDNPNVEGGGYTTVEDYGKLLLMHLRGGRCGSRRVLSEASVARMQEDRIAEAYDGSTVDPSLPGYGLGWWVSRDQPGLVADAGAYGASPWLDATRGIAVMVILEADPELGPAVRHLVQPLVESIFDTAAAAAP